MGWLLRVFQQLRNRVTGREVECDHKRHWIEKRWLDSDGTPMVHFYCRECGFVDRGHVHAEPEGWAGTTESP